MGIASCSVLLKTSNQTQTSHSSAVYEQVVHFAFSVTFLRILRSGFGARL